MTPQERERLVFYRTLATFNRDQIADYARLLGKEEDEKITASKVEPKTEPVVEVKEEAKSLKN
jgi:hypothetical protein